jgi:hypothetical protein
MTRFTTPVTIRTCGPSARLEAGASLVTSRCCSMPSTWLHQIRSTFFFSHREFLAYQDIWEKRPPRVGRGILGCHTCRRICLLSFLLERTNENNGHASASSAPNKLLINEERHTWCLFLILVQQLETAVDRNLSNRAASASELSRWLPEHAHQKKSCSVTEDWPQFWFASPNSDTSNKLSSILNPHGHCQQAHLSHTVNCSRPGISTRLPCVF